MAKKYVFICCLLFTPSFPLSGHSADVAWTVNTHLVSWSAPQAVWVELVDVEDVDGTLDAQMMELTGDLQEQKVVL